MCGIAGIYSQTNLNNINEIINNFINKLSHRGPDSNNFWVNNNLALIHTRLSILDLTNTGKQPMMSKDHNLIIVFNGEIYNHLELRETLLKEEHSIKWDGNSDTETLLTCIQFWGLHKTLINIVGMFSFALWDIKNNLLHLTRDRFGEKPLYYSLINSDLVFASELKALKCYPGFNNSISKIALEKYLKLSYVPTPYSIYNGVYKLEPGSCLTIKNIKKGFTNKINIDFEDEFVKYYKWWNPKHEIINTNKNIISNYNEAKNLIKTQLNYTIKNQMIADVPIGAFLSGGIDSSTVVSLMKNHTNNSIETFTIGFKENIYDESIYAEKVANHLNTNHNTVLLNYDDAMNIIPNLCNVYDEPFADSSQIPTFLVSNIARKKVKVSLTGDGADEIFGGYNRYIYGAKVWKFTKILPKVINDKLLNILNNIISNEKNNFLKVTRPSEKLQKIINSLKNVDSKNDFYNNLITKWQSDSNILLDGFRMYNEDYDVSFLDDFESQMMYLDTISYLTDDILCKVDRASMSNSLETRAPFLDHRLFQLAWSLPTKYKINNNIGKIILRDILYESVPKKLLDRPKIGFSIPLHDWLRGPLKQWADTLLNRTFIEEQGLFNYDIINTTWIEHLNKRIDHTEKLWTILMFQSWYKSNII